MLTILFIFRVQGMDPNAELVLPTPGNGGDPIALIAQAPPKVQAAPTRDRLLKPGTSSLLSNQGERGRGGAIAPVY